MAKFGTISACFLSAVVLLLLLPACHKKNSVPAAYAVDSTFERGGSNYAMYSVGNINYIMQWPLARGASQQNFSVQYPAEFSAYLYP